MAGCGADAEGQAAAVDIRGAQDHRQWGVFIRSQRLRVCDRGVVHCADRQADRGRGRIDRSVVDLESEAVRAGVIRRRGVGQVRGRAAQARRAPGW